MVSDLTSGTNPSVAHHLKDVFSSQFFPHPMSSTTPSINPNAHSQGFTAYGAISVRPNGKMIKAFREYVTDSISSTAGAPAGRPSSLAHLPGVVPLPAPGEPPHPFLFLGIPKLRGPLWVVTVGSWVDIFRTPP